MLHVRIDSVDLYRNAIQIKSVTPDFSLLEPEFGSNTINDLPFGIEQLQGQIV